MNFIAIPTAVVLLAILSAEGTAECLYFKTINLADAGALEFKRFAGR